ncbi:MAG: HAMP domain-containing sensor histidine kinase [Tissierellia bacterium]|nr:HAMP domain-containing sensor histidine kinase [Tissierellia bacterium]
MKNKKLFILILLLSLIFSAAIFFIIDKIYFVEISKIFDLNEYGYLKSMILYENRTLVFMLLIGISILFSILIYQILKKRESNYTYYLETIRKKLAQISAGNYEINPEEVEKLGTLFDELSKLIIEFREKSELANYDKLKIKEALEDISHQIKTPIASIEILLELEKSNPGNYIKKIEREIARINDLISNLLILAKLDINQIEFQKKEILAKDIIYTALETLQNIIDEKNIKIEISGFDFQITGDYYWLVEAFINILKNSIEYAKKNLKIKFAEKNVYNQIEIIDDGTGFIESDINKIFHRFYQSKNAKSGIGIGLNMAKNILNAHNATINAKNDSGGVFVIKFYK